MNTEKPEPNDVQLESLDADAIAELKSLHTEATEDPLKGVNLADVLAALTGDEAPKEPSKYEL